MSDNNGSFTQAPAPWTCKCEAYWMLFYSGRDRLPDNVYGPLEAQSASFSNPEKAGRFRGGLGMIQIVRYSDTPVGQSVPLSSLRRRLLGQQPNDRTSADVLFEKGSYDELLLIPGFFNVPGAPPTNKHGRITRIYVSQRDTCYNGQDGLPPQYPYV